MPSPKPKAPFFGSGKPNGQGLLIALIILCAISFLMIYSKIDLEANMNAGAIAQLRQQVAQVETHVAAPLMIPSEDQTAATSTLQKLVTSENGALTLVGMGKCSDPNMYSIKQTDLARTVEYKFMLRHAEENALTVTALPPGGLEITGGISEPGCKFAILMNE